MSHTKIEFSHLASLPLHFTDGKNFAQEMLVVVMKLSVLEKTYNKITQQDKCSHCLHTAAMASAWRWKISGQFDVQ